MRSNQTIRVLRGAHDQPLAPSPSPDGPCTPQAQGDAGSDARRPGIHLRPQPGHVQHAVSSSDASWRAAAPLCAYCLAVHQQPIDRMAFARRRISRMKGVEECTGKEGEGRSRSVPMSEAMSGEPGPGEMTMQSNRYSEQDPGLAPSPLPAENDSAASALPDAGACRCPPGMQGSIRSGLRVSHERSSLRSTTGGTERTRHNTARGARQPNGR